MKKLILFLSIIGCIVLGSSTAYSIDWMKPIGTESGYSARMIASEDGIEVQVQKTQNDQFWHIQSISEKPIPIKEKRYRIKFEAWSNKSFDLFSRLGESNVHKGNSYKDYSWTIDNYDKWKVYTHEFNGYSGKNYLYFQFGFAPPETLVKIRNIEITEIQ